MDRTTTYQFTVKDLDDPRLAELKKEIAAYNKVVRKEVRAGSAVVDTWGNKDKFQTKMSLLRVRIMPRGPRNVHGIRDYKSKMAYWAYLPQRYGTHFDIYVNPDYPNNAELAREIETGLRPGQLKLLDRKQRELWRIEHDIECSLREHGIYRNGDGHISRERYIQQMRDSGYPESIIERIV